MKTLMNVKTYTLIAILVTLLSCNGYTQENNTPTRTKKFELNQPGTLNAKSSGGRIKVKTHDQNEVVIELYIRKNGKVLSPSDPMVKVVLDNYELELEKNGSLITAIAKRKTNFTPWNNTGISLTIIVPKEMSCNVSSSGGGVKISGVDGTHNFSSSGGSVQLENTYGNTIAKSSGGRVKATNHKGNIRLTSSGGSVSLDGAQGSVYAHSSGGGVKLYNIHGEVEASSSGGGVTVYGECRSVKAKSSGGSVRVNISNLRKELYLKSSGGGVDAIIQDGENLGLDLDLSSGRVKIDLNNFSGKAEKNRVIGTMNNGGIPVYMRASGGNVSVRYNE
ncbi:MAG: DUF4097 family beta strand repeat-containing protein [Prolixibacteraceae bacterium]|jgi:DUF4097 and DUF4098 domain-containing protein YvlB|nr:DUF4097 family beta strand repeat-containing protein [Prolixibacteraceae bacterium]